MRKTWTYENEKGEKAQVVYYGGITLGFIEGEEHRFTSPDAARATLAMWGFFDTKAKKEERKRGE